MGAYFSSVGAESEDPLPFSSGVPVDEKEVVIIDPKEKSEPKICKKCVMRMQKRMKSYSNTVVGYQKGVCKRQETLTALEQINDDMVEKARDDLEVASNARMESQKNNGIALPADKWKLRRVHNSYKRLKLLRNRLKKRLERNSKAILSLKNARDQAECRLESAKLMTESCLKNQHGNRPSL
jgi:hypothetical protein